jgi:Formiminotransferase-cyclodeaminase
MNQLTKSDPHSVSVQSLADFITNLGSTDPSPGSGAAAAVALALAAACTAKAFAVSHRHKSSVVLEAAAARARAVATIALEGAQRDGEDFRVWLRSHSQESVVALEQDAGLLLSLSSELERMAADHRSEVTASLLADLSAAARLIETFRAIEIFNNAQLRPADEAPGIAAT